MASEVVVRKTSGAVARAVDEIHSMLTSMQLMPGQAIRQEALAARLGLSRAPIREALGILKSEGVLEHERNVGYTVKRLTKSELDQAYMIRRALETEVVLAMPQLDEEAIAGLEELNAGIGEAGKSNDIATVRRLNYDFHFTIYAASKLDLVVSELRRMWAYTDAYRSFYLYDEAARSRIVREHAEIISALRDGDKERTAQLLDAHRSQVPVHLAMFLDAQAAAMPGGG